MHTPSRSHANAAGQDSHAAHQAEINSWLQLTPLSAAGANAIADVLVKHPKLGVLDAGCAFPGKPTHTLMVQPRLKLQTSSPHSLRTATRSALEHTPSVSSPPATAPRHRDDCSRGFYAGCSWSGPAGHDPSICVQEDAVQGSLRHAQVRL